MPAYNEYLLPYKTDCHKIICNNTHVAEDIMKVTEEISEELRAEVLPKRLV
jgi:uridine kinase